MLKPTSIAIVIGVAAFGPHALAEEINYGPELTAEQLLSHWIGEPDRVLLPAPPKWKLDLNAHVGAGYKENVLFSALNERDSAFSLAEVDAFLFRESTSPNQFYLYGFADQRHYFDLGPEDNEQMIITEASWTRNLSLPATFNLRGTYSYIDQYFDASISELESDSIRLAQHDFGISSYVEKETFPHLTVRLGAGGNKVDLRDLDDDYARFSALARAEYKPSRQWKAGVTAQHDHDDYDERPSRTALGDRLEGESVAIATESLTLYTRYDWDAERKWQTHLSVTGRIRNDDGGGYYDYESWRGRLLLRGPVAGCRWEAGLYYGDTDYDVRPARFGDSASPHLFRTTWRVRARLERDLSSHTSLFAELSHEDNDSNDPLDVYTQTWAVLGAGYRL